LCILETLLVETLVANVLPLKYNIFENKDEKR